MPSLYVTYYVTYYVAISNIIGPQPESLGRQETRAFAKARFTQN